MAQVKFLKIANNVPTQHDTAADDITVASIAAATGSLTTSLSVGGNATAAGFIRFLEDSDNGSNYIQVECPASVAANYTFTLPASGGTSTFFMTTNGSGTTSWSSINDLTNDATPDSGADYVMTWDNSASGHKKVLLSNLPAGSNYDTATYTAAANLAKGDVVYMTSTADNVNIADADTLAHATAMVGIANASISSAASGAIMVKPGAICTGVLSGATAGTIYYLSTTGTTGNTLTTSAPSGGPILMQVGYAKNTTDLVWMPRFIADTV